MRDIIKDSWRDLVPGGFCYGESMDFAVHPNDEERAKKMIRAAIKEGASQEEIEEAVEEYCLGKTHLEENITETLENLQKMLPLNSRS